jgi:hypothetical protein
MNLIKCLFDTIDTGAAGKVDYISQILMFDLIKKQSFF